MHVVEAELVRNHELSQVADDLRGWSNLDDVAEEIIGGLVGLLGLSPLSTKTQLRSLEHHIGQLTTWNFVLVNLWVWTGKTGLERRVQQTKLGPVSVDGTNVMNVQSWVETTTLKRCKNSTNAWLGSHTRQAVSGSVNNISASISTGNHGSNTSTSRVVGVYVNRKIWVLLTNSTNEQGSSSWLENTSHVLDTKDVDIKCDELLDQGKVVLQVVLLLWVLIKGSVNVTVLFYYK